MSGHKSSQMRSLSSCPWLTVGLLVVLRPGIKCWLFEFIYPAWQLRLRRWRWESGMGELFSRDDWETVGATIWDAMRHNEAQEGWYNLLVTCLFRQAWQWMPLFPQLRQQPSCPEILSLLYLFSPHYYSRLEAMLRVCYMMNWMTIENEVLTTARTSFAFPPSPGAQRYTPNFAKPAAKLVCRASRKRCSMWPWFRPATSNLKLISLSLAY